MDKFPRRIVSLVPSQTELLSSLGLDDRLVGITKFCVHPSYIFKSKTRIGGTKNVNIARIKELKPDLILANKEENVKEQVEELAQDFTVWTSDVTDLASSLSMINQVGALTGTESKAADLCKKIYQAFSQLKPMTPRKKTLYLIWKDPYMSVGADTFIHDMLDRCGLENVLGQETRYPEVSPDTTPSPELILLSSEPFPFNEQHMKEVQQHWPEARIKLVDGEFFSWYGSRPLEACDYFEGLIKELER